MKYSDQTFNTIPLLWHMVIYMYITEKFKPNHKSIFVLLVLWSFCIALALKETID